MNHTHFATSDWYRAATLAERMVSLPVAPDQKGVDVERAQQRLARWQQQSPFATGTYFAERLAMAEITETQLWTLLGEPIEAVKARFATMPAWLVQIVQAFTEAATAPSPLSCVSALTHSADADNFLSLVEPLIVQGCQQVLEGIQQLRQEYVELPFDPQDVLTVLLANLTGPLHGILDRTLVLELNVSRLQGVLEGETAQARYHSFVERLRRPEIALALLQEYPVVARQTTICINYWVTFSLEFLRHLCADWEAIQATFSPDQHPGLLTEVRGGAGDRHRQGRSVLIATFSSGFQLVYKPRSLAVDAHFQSLLSWINARSDRLSFRTLKVLNRTRYGWLEFVTAHSCTTQDDVQRFYERQGAYLALLYAVQATDFHAENLIAAGEQPILVDLESLFHPPMGESDASKANLLASEKVAYSVLGIGLLPQRVWGNDAVEGIDLSGLGAKQGQLTPHQLPYWEAAATDAMRLAHKRMAIPGEQNRPTLQGQEVNLLHYEEALVSGFIRASLVTVHLGLSEVTFPTYALTTPQTLADREQLLAAACAIGDRLEALAVRGAHDAAWIGLTFVGEREWTLVSLGLDLYDGLPGITLFLAYLGAMTGEARYTALARAALRAVHHQIEKYQADLKWIGAFGGWGGIIYLLTHVAVLWKQPELLTEAEKIVAYLPP